MDTLAPGRAEATSPRSATQELRKPRVWVLSEYFYPNEINTGYVMSEIAAGLQQQFDVRVISGSEANFVTGETTIARECWRGIEIRRCRGTRFNRKSFVGRLCNAITLSSAIFFAALRSVGRGDIILVVTNPPFLPFSALLVKWLKRSRLVLVVHDVYPEAAIAAGLLQRESLTARIMTRATRLLLRQTDRVVTLGRDMCRLVQRKAGAGHAHKVVVIPNWAEHERVAPVARDANPLLHQLGLSGKFVVLHAGNMGYVQDIEVLVRAATLLRDRKDIAFMFIGSGVKGNWLENAKRELQLDNIVLCPPQGRDQQHVFLNACDLAAMALVPGMGGVSVPSRMYSQMAVAKPWVAAVDPESEVAIVIREEQIGWAVPEGDAEALAAAIAAAAADREQCVAMGQRARHASLERYGVHHAVNAYRQLLGSL